MAYTAAGNGTLTYTLGGSTLTANNLAETSRFSKGINTLYLRTRSALNSSATLQNLGVGKTSFANTTLSSNGLNDVDYLKITGITGDFTLTGQAILSWISTPGPKNSALAFQVKGGYEAPPTSSEIPEPLTILGTGLALGFGTLFKKELANRDRKVTQDS